MVFQYLTALLLIYLLLEQSCILIQDPLHKGGGHIHALIGDGVQKGGDLYGGGHQFALAKAEVCQLAGIFQGGSLGQIAAGAFQARRHGERLPQPQVTSAVVSLRVRKEKPWDIQNQSVFFRAVRSSFAMRRKKLSNGLASGFPELGKSGAAQVIAACGFPGDIRGETLGIPEFARLANEICRRICK